jgi:hypothetical protein
MPVYLDENTGLGLTQTIPEVVKQNFKNLIFTSPGERIMLPDFGVGIYSFLFEQNTEATYGLIRSRINTQTAQWIPQINIQDIDIGTTDEAPETMNLTIIYDIGDLAISDVLALRIERSQCNSVNHFGWSGG